MHPNAGFVTVVMNIAADVMATIDNEHIPSMIGEHPGDDRPCQAGSNDEIINSIM